MCIRDSGKEQCLRKGGDPVHSLLVRRTIADKRYVFCNGKLVSGSFFLSLIHISAFRQQLIALGGSADIIVEADAPFLIFLSLIHI